MVIRSHPVSMAECFKTTSLFRISFWQEVAKLAQSYVTKRKKGTGLGGAKYQLLSELCDRVKMRSKN